MAIKKRNFNRRRSSGPTVAISAPPRTRLGIRARGAQREIARKIYDLRMKAGVSQRALAKKVRTTASTICRLEDAGYDGHSLYLLKRIAEPLDKRVDSLRGCEAAPGCLRAIYFRTPAGNRGWPPLHSARIKGSDGGLRRTICPLLIALR